VDHLQARRDALLSLLDGAPALVASASLRSIEGDYPQDSDFRQDNDFFYLTGLESRDAWLVLNHPDPGAVVLYLPPRDPAAERWTGPVLGPDEEASRRTGIPDVRSAEAFPSALGALAAGPGPVWLAPGARRALAGHAAEAPDMMTGAADAAPLLARLRLVKDEDELRRIRSALEVTSRGIREAWRVAEPGIHEYELEAVVEYHFRAGGAERVGFPSIIGSGPNSTILHYDKNRRRTREGDLVVMDVGAEYGYYSADITRTFPVSGRFTPRQRALYELVLGAQEAALAKVRPGATVADLTREARRYMDANSGSLCGEAPCTRYFVHGLSHWLGMDVHDVGDYGTRLAPGMVITIEPGVYIEGEEIGIRIEDDVLVTASGYELLTGALPRDPDAVEAAMAETPRQIRVRE